MNGLHPPSFEKSLGGIQLAKRIDESVGHDRSPVSPAGRFMTTGDVRFNLVRIKGKSSALK
jgi:hypothetical protein